MHIFVINLDRSTKRLNAIDSQLKKLGLSYERVSAVDGAELGNFEENFNTKRFAHESGHRLVPGEAGCSASHLKIWKIIIKRKLEHALILEDDVLLSQNLPTLLNNKILYQKFDYFKLDNPIDKVAEALHCSQNKILESNKIIASYEVENFKALELDPVPYLTGGYIISQKACKTFLKSSKKMYYPIDLLPRYSFPYTRQGVLIPNLISHPEIRNSEIGGRYFNPTFKLPFYSYLNKLFSLRSLRIISVKIKKLAG